MSRLLILDYSTDRAETALTRRWVPEGVEVDAFFVDSAESFPDELLDVGYTHVIHTGSALSINDVQPFTEKAVWHLNRFVEQGVAQMGICYGHQLLCYATVGPHGVRKSPNDMEAGWKKVSFCPLARSLLDVREQETVWQSHLDEVVELPPGSEILATNEHTRIQGFLNERMKLLGTQFHPEFDAIKGNEQFEKDRRLLEANGVEVDAEIGGQPSFDTGRVLLEFFVRHFG